MKVYLTDQQDRLERHLERLKGQPVMAYDPARLKERVTTISLRPGLPFEAIDHRFLFEYRIFPPNIMSFLAQWNSEGRGMRVGDTIVQQVFLPPIRGFSQKLVFAVRINEIIDRPDCKGFSYETVEGHVEKGISTFSLEDHGQEVLFKVITRSGAGNMLSKLLGPVFSVPYQAFCTRAALRNVERQVLGQRK